jgi:hypothetical protein
MQVIMKTVARILQAVYLDKILQRIKYFDVKYDADLYRGRQVALLTQHGKEHVIAPVLHSVLGCRVERVSGYDTDLLGTFSRDIPRDGTQVEAAREKARIGMEIACLPLGLASEGSFGPDPFTGILPWNIEVLIWIDKECDLEITAVAQGKTNLNHTLITHWEEAEAFARKTGFPEHQLVVRPEDENDIRIRKGIANWTDLQTAFSWALDTSENGCVFIETDMRAHANPTRMNNIRLAAEELAKKLSSTCPACGAPGYWIIERLTGLPCKGCGLPTHEIRAEVHGCCKCTHQVTHERADRMHADPSRCDYCNP